MRSVFSMTGAFLGRVDGETRCAFWPDDPAEHGFDPSRLVAIDLARTPNAALAGTIPWEAIEVDDCVTGPNGELSGTTLGPRWPEMQIAGVVLLEERFVRRLPEAIAPACPPRGIGGRDYEYTSVLYWPGCDDPRAGRRYAGHHAEILEERGSLARVKLYPRGSSESPDVATTTMWIDLASPEQCDAGPESLTRIGAGARPKSGALFLASGKL